MELSDCIDKGFLVRIKPDAKLVEKELAESAYDLEKARKALNESDYKWSIVKAYYAMFHSARAILFQIGLMEKRHFAVAVALRHLNKQGKLESRFVRSYEAAVSSREEADYHYTHSRQVAEETLALAEEFSERMRELLKKL